MRLKPVSGRPVPDPAFGDLLPDAGREVDPNDPYWIRRLNDGDVVETPAPADKASATAKE